MADRASLRLSATLVFIGVLASLAVGIMHPSHEPPNDHAAVFAEYAASTNWIAVHLGQFIGMAVVIAGLLALPVALDLRAGVAAWLARFGATAAGTALALYGVLQAVDGVALKHAVDALASAPEAEQATRMASAEAVRWLEWGTRSYQSITLGIALLLLGGAIAWSARAPRPIGILMVASGVAYIAQGWVVGAEGFAATNVIPTLLGYALFTVWSLWLLIFAWGMKAPSAPSDTNEHAAAAAFR